MYADANSITFLDTDIFREIARKLAVRNFVKTIDWNLLLHYNSYHTKSLRKNLPYGQFLRIKRNSSKLLDYIKGAEQRACSLGKRGYPDKVIQQTRKRTEAIIDESCYNMKNLLTPRNLCLRSKTHA